LQVEFIFKDSHSNHSPAYYSILLLKSYLSYLSVNVDIVIVHHLMLHQKNPALY